MIRAVLSILSSLLSVLPRLLDEYRDAQAERERVKRDARNEQAIRDAQK